MTQPISPEIHYHTGSFTPHKIILSLLGSAALITCAIGVIALLHQQKLLNFWPQMGTLSLTTIKSLIWAGGGVAAASLIAAVALIVKHFKDRRPLMRVIEHYKDQFKPHYSFETSGKFYQTKGQHDEITGVNMYLIALSNNGKRQIHYFLNEELKKRFEASLDRRDYITEM